MGSSYSRPRELNIWEKPAKSKRSHAAEPVTSALIKYTVENVLLSIPNRVRECYEVSRDLRNRAVQLRWVVRPLIQGSDIGNGVTLAEKIVMIFIDQVNLEIIRPGPTPADREMTDIAEELRAFGERFAVTCAQIIAVDDVEKKLK